MQIDNNDSPNYSTSGSHMELWDFDGGDYQKWQLIHLADGYYKILSVKSSKVICVENGDTNANAMDSIQINKLTTHASVETGISIYRASNEVVE